MWWSVNWVRLLFLPLNWRKPCTAAKTLIMA
ncbi:Uncharacterised protein [Vibrio cholerae]|nr:Uncharacterised protein [Vibrio cholerae]